MTLTRPFVRCRQGNGRFNPARRAWFFTEHHREAVSLHNTETGFLLFFLFVVLKTMNIELATQHDVEDIFSLLSRCRDKLIEQDIFQWGDDYPKFESVAKDVTKGSLTKLTYNDQLVGVISVDDVQDPEYKTVNWQIDSDSIAVIHRLAVDPLFQGKGFAKYLMNYAENTISESGFQAIRLDAYSGNEMLCGFYKNLGYKCAGEISFPSRPLPFMCMEKSTKI